MDLDRTELQDSARRMLQDSGLAPDREKTWGRVAEMGWLALTAPEDLGGLGQAHAALGVLHAELGRVLAPVPFLPTMLAVEAICRSAGFADRQAWLDRLFAGEVVTAALRPAAVEAHADGAGGWTLTGALDALPDADMAGHMLVWTEDVCGLVPLAQPGVKLTPRVMWDKSRRLFEARLDGAKLPADLVLAQRDAGALGRELQIQLLSALAADSLGAAGALLELTVEYLQTRRQFGRPLAMFQALKHRCADLKARLTGAEALFWRAADDAHGASPFLDALVQAGGLKSHAAAVFYAIAEEAIQLHGGIGLTAEHPCHLFLKRALLNAALGGEADAWEAAAGQQALRKLARG